MAVDEVTQQALEVGRELAGEVLEFRSRALDERAAAVQARADELEAEPAAAFEPALVEAVGLGSAGVLVAEGDSWFDYPWNDVLRLLEDEHAFDVESVAHKGDRIEEMAYSGGQLEEFTRRLEKLLRRGVVPRALLLSGGGNDIAGREFGMLLNHSRSGPALRGLNDQVISGVIDQRIRFAYVTVISAVTTLCEQRLGRRLPILVHGYDHPVPDGRGFLGGWWSLPGPWLEPGFREKGYAQLAERTTLAGRLIDRFNGMLQAIVALPDLSHVVFVDLRGTLSTGADYREWWANELHPTPEGFRRVAARIAARIP